MFLFSRSDRGLFFKIKVRFYYTLHSSVLWNVDVVHRMLLNIITCVKYKINYANMIYFFLIHFILQTLMFRRREMTEGLKIYYWFKNGSCPTHLSGLALWLAGVAVRFHALGLLARLIEWKGKVRILNLSLLISKLKVVLKSERVKMNETLVEYFDFERSFDEKVAFKWFQENWWVKSE